MQTSQSRTFGAAFFVFFSGQSAQLQKRLSNFLQISLLCSLFADVKEKDVKGEGKDDRKKDA
ncbi:hypothetical protein J26TS2_28390 [Shouchella clausii]|nr:hypothetical protein J26TS2_28390 [Shouchella clausii]